MYFVSGIFILFVLITVLVYYLIPGKYQWVVLLAGNIVFYLWGGPWAGIYLLVTTVSTFTAGLLLDKLNIKKKDIPKDDWAVRWNEAIDSCCEEIRKYFDVVE